MILLDTSMILRSKQKSSSHYHFITEKLIEMVSIGEELVVCPQVIYEFYVVATRPHDKNGFGLSAETAIGEIENILSTYSMLAETDQVYFNWLKLISDYKVIGKNAHDARIVAFMVSNSISSLYTLNKKDFERFHSIIELI